VTDLHTPTVNLIGNGPLPAKQVVVLRSLRGLGQIVATTQWCLIGGLMVEILLISRGALMFRPTDDGDIIGDVVADRSVLRKLARGLIDMGFEELPAGRGGEIGVRFREPTSGAFIDVLAPEASLRLRRVVPTQSEPSAVSATERTKSCAKPCAGPDTDNFRRTSRLSPALRVPTQRLPS